MLNQSISLVVGWRRNSPAMDVSGNTQGYSLSMTMLFLLSCNATQSSSLKQVVSGHWRPSGNSGRQGHTWTLPASHATSANVLVRRGSGYAHRRTHLPTSKFTVIRDPSCRRLIDHNATLGVGSIMMSFRRDHVWRLIASDNVSRGPLAVCITVVTFFRQFSYSLYTSIV